MPIDAVVPVVVATAALLPIVAVSPVIAVCAPSYLAGLFGYGPYDPKWL
jgi:hypothetical protein